jgi:hypothetical protein
MENMTASKSKLTLAQRLAVYDRRRELEARRPGGATARMLALQSDPDFDPEVSALPHARPAAAKCRPAVVAETRRQVAKACEAADRAARVRRAQLGAIARGILPHTERWESAGTAWT